MARSRNDPQLRRLLRAVDAAAPKALAAAARAGFKAAVDTAIPELVAVYGGAESFFDESGALTPLGEVSPEWQATKAKLGLDFRKGHGTGTTAMAIDDPAAIVETEDGFVYDVSLASSLVAPYPGGAVSLSEYLKHYTDQKAPGLGGFSEEANEEIQTKMDEAAQAEFEEVRRQALLLDSARKPGSAIFAEGLPVTTAIEERIVIQLTIPVDIGG